GRHQVGIDVQPDRGVLAVLARLLLELCHAVEPADACHAVEYPGEFGVLGDLALIEDDVALGIDAARNEGGCHFADGARQFSRILPDRDGMKIDRAIDAFVPLLLRYELSDRAVIGSQAPVRGLLPPGTNT